MEKHVYLVRHAETNENTDRILRGAHSELTEYGHSQAKEVAKRMGKIEIEAIITSPFKRAVDTARAIHETTYAPIEENADFIEYERPSITLGKHEHDPEVIQLRDLIYEKHTDPTFKHSDEESFLEIKKRGLRALSFIESHPAERICVVTHGFFLRALLGLVLLGEDFSGKEFQKMYKHVRGSNTGITYLQFKEGTWRLVTWNDSAHLG